MDQQRVQDALESIANRMSLSDEIQQAWLEAIMEVGTGTHAHAEDTIISVIDPNAKIGYLLLSGDYCVQKQGNPELIKSAPELLGEMAEINPSGRRIASVRAVTDIDMVSFSWDKLNSALIDRLSEEQVASLRHGLDNYAWDHFTE